MTPRTRTAALTLSGFLISSPSFSQTGPPVPDFLRDLNQDGTIDFQDLLILVEMWGLEGIVPPTPSPSSMQTPASTETPTQTSTENPTVTDAITIDLPAPSIQMIRIPAGSFMMGSPDSERSRGSDEGPVHEVVIGYDFYMSEVEVTHELWRRVMGASPLELCDEPMDHPVVRVSWDDCQSFIAALNTGGNGAFRLPSEAEWEYACRAGSTTRFYFGDSTLCEDDCSNCEAQHARSASRGGFPANSRSLNTGFRIVWTP